MNIERLDEFSRAVANRLLSKFPYWRDFATVETSSDGVCYLNVTVPAPPQAQTQYGLIVTTEDRVVTVGFDYFHTHFHSAVGDGEHFGTDYAFHFIDDVLSERIAAISWWLGEDLVAFSTRKNGVNAMPDALIGPHDRERVRSWKGSLNADRAA
jgi:hypothetical protein